MTALSMYFDFNAAVDRAVLSALQAQGYNLLGYKGAVGPNPLTTGVPTWFSVPFTSMFGAVEIEYTPIYKLYVTTQWNIPANGSVQMQAMSSPVQLGSAQTFNADGSFSAGGVSSVPADSLGLFNNRPFGTPPLTVGLACQVNTPDASQYLPFCAFTLNPQGSIIMKPLENILLVASRLKLQSGNVQTNVLSPGCTFSFSASNFEYDLQVMASTFGITHQPGRVPVLPVSAGATISGVINSAN